MLSQVKTGSKELPGASAVRGNTVCRFHGACGGAPTGQANGRYRHGGRTKQAQAERRYLAAVLRAAREGLGVPSQQKGNTRSEPPP